MKSEAFANMAKTQEDLQEEMNKLKEVYGDIVVNLETGEYEDAPEEAEVVEE